MVRGGRCAYTSLSRSIPPPSPHPVPVKMGMCPVPRLGLRPKPSYGRVHPNTHWKACPIHLPSRAFEPINTTVARDGWATQMMSCGPTHA